MRCLFLDGLTRTERLERDEFDERCRHLFSSLAENPHVTRGELRRELQALDPEFELTHLHVDSNGTVTLSLDARVRAAKPRLQRLASFAPDTVRVRQNPGPRALEEVSTAMPERFGQSLDGARVRAGFARGHLLDLVVHLRHASTAQDEAALAAAEEAVYALLGEQRADDWIGQIDVAPLPHGGPLRLVGKENEQDSTFPLSLLFTTVENAIRGLHEGMHTAEPPGQGAAEWTLLEADPREAVSPSAQGDLLYASTSHPEMLKCFLEGAPFSSCRFSARGEHFAYLKFVHPGENQSRVVERQALEDEIEALLSQDGLGRVVGNGIGTEHSYVDLALTDVSGTLEALRRSARELLLPRSSWVLFCDSEWRREWIGVYSDAPPPELG